VTNDDPLAPPLSYRDLRNTPGVVAERLADGRPVPVNIDGETRALLVPMPEGISPAEFARSLAALRAMQRWSVERGLDTMTVDDIDDVIAEARAEQMRTELPAGAPLTGPYGEDPPRRPGRVPRHQRPTR
jgi:hypothetical protein